MWTAASYLYVAGQLVDEWGQNVPTVADGPLAHQVVRDLVGRCLRGIVDPSCVETATTDFRIDEMDYRDGVTPAQVLTDLEEVHTGHLWRVGQRDLGTGLRPLTWAEWDSDPRYILPSTADVDLSGSDIHVEVDLGTGDEGSATVRTTDLSHAYVEENSAYSS